MPNANEIANFTWQNIFEIESGSEKSAQDEVNSFLYVHPNDQTQPTFEMTPGFKPFTVFLCYT